MALDLSPGPLPNIALLGGFSTAAINQGGEAAFLPHIGLMLSAPAVANQGGDAAFLPHLGLMLGASSATGGILVGRFPLVQKRYVVRRGRKLLVFADHAQAQAVQQAVDKAADDARQVIERASQTSNRAARRARRSAQEAVEVMLSGLLQQVPPVDVADLREAQAMAQAYHQHQAMNDAIRLRDYESALRMWQEMRDDEDAVAALLECTV